MADSHMVADLLHGEERKVWGDAGYQGQRGKIREAAPHAQDMPCRRTKFKKYVAEEATRKTPTNTANGWPLWGRSVSEGRKIAPRDGYKASAHL